MTESLPELIARRMGELGITSLRALHGRLPVGHDSITYETVRNLANGKQRGSRDERVYRDLALMLEVDENIVRAAMNTGPTYGPWDLPARAQGLDPHEREIVVGVVDALLRAKRGGHNEGWQPEDQKIDDDPIRVTTRTDTTLAARRMSSLGEQLQAEADRLGEESQDDDVGTDPA